MADVWIIAGNYVQLFAVEPDEIDCIAFIEPIRSCDRSISLLLV